ncbi:hypothetical protein K493DRAFT_275163 [Basidiobolus meristosporus CBS 931.73]|uniref:BHLH domain-containing protein n=1 Tax=Basidiobolus meristosporus CBS 931.73 TaxID=1314790 RepID=A0A1Y1Z527_9FUNG|nr:hypothetical protein K493DRAFT_275163 [Basidiobolus meristosporus CBS 931.73]|eukprot:ORY05363.1 hypothetical protein K493DRAFT_275163 [Basidiobolus meristosporus CBS 931.73]
MPPLNYYKDQVDFSSYFSYTGNNAATRFSTPFDVDSVNGDTHRKGSQVPSDQPLFLNFTADLNPQNGGKKQKMKKKNSYKVNGVNILNRKSLDSSTALERLQKRRENHNSVERKRRDNINATIMEISELLPGGVSTSSKPNKGNILKLASKYIKELKHEVRSLKNEVRVLKGEEPVEEEPDEDPKDIRKRKTIDNESSGESDEDNDIGDQDEQEMENDEDTLSSAEPSRQVSPETTPENDIQSDEHKQPEEVKDTTEPKAISKACEKEVSPEPQVAEVEQSKGSDLNKDHSELEPVKGSTKQYLESPVSSQEYSDNFNTLNTADKLASYPILGGSKRQRADNYALPGMGQFAMMAAPTLSHMHTFNAAPRQSAPASPFGFQLPGPSHHATPTPPPNDQSHFVNHMASVPSYQPHPHARGPPNMMFREYNGNINMY